MTSTRQFAADEIIQQIFPFKSPLLKYIFDNINYKHLHKLYQCCKFFPNKFPLIIVHKITDNVKCVNELIPSFYYNGQSIQPKNISKIYLSSKLNLKRFQPKLSKWISKVLICTIKKIRIKNQDLMVNDFRILTQNGTVETLDIRNVLNENGLRLSIDEIFSYVPKADKIDLDDPYITQNSFTNLSIFERKSKISRFTLDRVIMEIDPEQLLKFIEAHASNIHSEFNIYFSHQIPHQNIQDFCSTMKFKIYFNENFKNFIDKPCFFSRSA